MVDESPGRPFEVGGEQRIAVTPGWGLEAEVVQNGIRDMKSAAELLEAYLDNVRTPKVSASQFADDGVLELPWVQAHAQGPAAVERLLAGMLAKIPDFRFKNLTYFIRTPDQVAAEYQVEARVAETDKLYQQTYVGVLLAESGKIKLLREALDTVAAAKAFSKD